MTEQQLTDLIVHGTSWSKNGERVDPASVYQPEALRLADEMDAYHTRSCHKEAAAELRRLHAENERLKQALQAFAKKHRRTYGLEGAWDEEITLAEQALGDR